MSNPEKICFFSGGTSPGFGRKKRSLSDPAPPPLVDVFLNDKDNDDDKDDNDNNNKRRKRSLSDPAQPPLVDVFLNPARTNEKKLIEEQMMNVTRSLFSPPLPPSSFPNFFRLLRHTSLLCGAPAGSASSRMLLKCMWAGKEFECGDIFTPVPTDSGICCAFNPRTILR